MENYISKWKASEIDELLGKAIDKTIVEKGDGALELKIILKDGSSVTLPVRLGSGLSVDNDGTISVNDIFQFGGIVSGVSVETSTSSAAYIYSCSLSVAMPVCTEVVITPSA